MSKSFADNKMAPPAPAAPPAPQGAPCVLGPTLHFKGELYGEEDLEFQGQLEGSIEHTRSLSIGKEGSVKGNIRAKFVIIEGRSRVTSTRRESVSIRQNAKMTGNIFAPRVGIADGAHFCGRIDMNHKGVASKADHGRQVAQRTAGGTSAGCRAADRFRSELFHDLRGKRAQVILRASAALLDSNTSASFASGYSSTFEANP